MPPTTFGIETVSHSGSPVTLTSGRQPIHVVDPFGRCVPRGQRTSLRIRSITQDSLMPGSAHAVRPSTVTRYDSAAQNAATSPGFPTSGDSKNVAPPAHLCREEAHAARGCPFPEMRSLGTRRDDPLL